MDQALARFKDARPPGVKHEDFVNELRRRYEASGEAVDVLCRVAEEGDESVPSASGRSERDDPNIIIGAPAPLRPGGVGAIYASGHQRGGSTDGMPGPSGPGRPPCSGAGQSRADGDRECTTSGAALTDFISPSRLDEGTWHVSRLKASLTESQYKVLSKENESFGFTERAILQGMR